MKILLFILFFELSISLSIKLLDLIPVVITKLLFLADILFIKFVKFSNEG